MTDEKIYDLLTDINIKLSAVATEVKAVVEVKKDINKIEDCQVKMKGDIRELKVKSSIFGFVGGSIPASIAVVISLLKGN